MTRELADVTEFLAGTRAVESFPWHALRRADLRVIRDWLGETRPTSTQRRILTDLRSAIESHDSADDSLPDDAQPPAGFSARGRTSTPNGTLSRKAARLLLDACDGDDVRVTRDRGIIALMLLGGLRRQEVVALDESDYEDQEHCLYVHSRAFPARIVVLEGECRDAIESWLSIRGHAPGALFPRINGNGGRLTSSAVNHVVERYARLTGGHLTPNDLRQAFRRQLRLAESQGAFTRCRYSQTQEGAPAWTLVSQASA